MTGTPTIPWKKDLLVLCTTIRRVRRSRRMTQAEAAQLLDMTERSYRDWENGHRDIAATNLFILAAALGIRVFDSDTHRKNTSGSAHEVTE